MIQEKIVTYEVAKLASEAGFKSFTRSYYMIGDKEPFFVGEAKNWNAHSDRYSAPTQSLLQKWLRKNKEIHIVVSIKARGGETYWYYELLALGFFMQWLDGESMFSQQYRSYEEALEAGLKRALITYVVE